MRSVWKKTGLFAACLAILCMGCGKEQADITPGETITLLEPVGSAGNYEAAAYRTIYDASVYDATVYPYVEEYAFLEGKTFEAYGAYPGEEVKAGDALIYTNSESLEKQIESLEEQIQTMEEEFTKFRTETLEAVESPKGYLAWYEQLLEDLEANVPAATILDEEGREVTNPDYTRWQADCRQVDSLYAQTLIGVQLKEVALKQREELYHLDHAYYTELLASLQEKAKQSVLASETDGNVAAVAFYDSGDYIGQDEVVMAVCNDSTLELKCDYINKSVITKAEDVYACINGVRYEVEYVPMDSDEYARLSAENDKVYSTFTLLDAKEVSIGDFGVITVINDVGKEVLSVPKAALHKDTEGYYVSVYQDGETVSVSVKTGMSDGVYTEITDGLQAGDLVLVEQAAAAFDKVVTVGYGDFSNTLNVNGYLYYPSSYAVRNPIEYGTAYFVESQVALYQHVEAGDVIATIYVKGDDTALLQQERKLQRMQERLADLQAAGAEENAEEIAQRNEAIDELTELIEEMKADYATIEIVAEESGIVIELANIEKDSILSSDAFLARIADESNCYVVVDNEEQKLQYGTEVTISYQNREGQSCTADGEVVLLTPAGVMNQSLKADYTLIRIPREAIGEMAATTQGADGWWNRNRFGITAQIRQMQHVLVVPRSAVRFSNGRTYVNVKLEDGSVVATSFVAGGYDDRNYWVVEGLTEGMELCYE